MTLTVRGKAEPRSVPTGFRREPYPHLKALAGGSKGPEEATAPEPSLKRARVIAVTSGKGGVGKSSLVANLSVAMTRLGKSVVAFDADLGMANLDVLFGVRPQYTLYHVLRGKRDLTDVLVSGPPGVKFVAGGSGMRELADMDEDSMRRLLHELRRLETYADVLLVDTGAGLSRNVLSFVRAAGEVLLVTTPEPTAMADAYGVLKTLALDGGGVCPRPCLVVNKVKNPEEGLLVARRMAKVAREHLQLKLDYIGFVLEDDAVSQAVRRQKPLVLLSPNSYASVCINNLVSSLFNAPVPAPSQPSSGFFEKVAGLFGRH